MTSLGLNGVVARFLAINVITVDGALHVELDPLKGHLLMQTLTQSPGAQLMVARVPSQRGTFRGRTRGFSSWVIP